MPFSLQSNAAPAFTLPGFATSNAKPLLLVTITGVATTKGLAFVIPALPPPRPPTTAKTALLTLTPSGLALPSTFALVRGRAVAMMRVSAFARYS